MEDLAVYGLRFLEEHYPNRLNERYGLTTVGDNIKFFESIGKLGNVYTTGGEIDYDKVAEFVVRDIRNELLGKLTFDFV